MNIFKRLYGIDRLFCWSFLGFLFGIWGVYTSFQKTSPELDIQITSDISVIDVHSPVKELEVKFAGQMIDNQKTNVRAFRIRFSNTGNQHILTNFYASDEKWGFEVASATLLSKPKIVAASTEYLKDRVLPVVEGEGQVVFSKIILEATKFFEIEFLISYDKNTEPQFIPFGVIAGVELPARILRKERQIADTTLSRTFSDSIWINLLRFFVNSLFFFIGLILLVHSSEAYKDRISKAGLKKLKDILTTYLGSRLGTEYSEEDLEQLVSSFQWPWFHKSEFEDNLKKASNKTLISELDSLDEKVADLKKKYSVSVSLNRHMHRFFLANSGPLETVIDPKRVKLAEEVFCYLDSKDCPIKLYGFGD